jgi:hypothetical protein
MFNKIYNSIKSLFVNSKQPIVESTYNNEVINNIAEPTVELVEEKVEPIVEEVVVKPKPKNKKPYRSKSKSKKVVKAD